MAGQPRDCGSNLGTGKRRICAETPKKPRTEWAPSGIYTVVKRKADHLPPCSMWLRLSGAVPPLYFSRVDPWRTSRT